MKKETRIGYQKAQSTYAIIYLKNFLLYAKMLM